MHIRTPLGYGNAGGAPDVLASIRAGMRKEKVALARKLSVVLHRVLRDTTTG